MGKRLIRVSSLRDADVGRADAGRSPEDDDEVARRVEIYTKCLAETGKIAWEP